ncbi:hypothetical protein tinsulaeT_36700 [Thalassotalea insulae]|uniref:DUF349 domain-containing protein n=1 Tax=Thalassotalea insulae TaxID=2056778 RepID=A0ABQ6GZX4_9GAMM|nr:DUF349 domain-containing protein [Thalassotalea insulae]GLX80330.1 hypothetical protein tinsulaeT_36700 [Thalassotalea insulae]
MIFSKFFKSAWQSKDVNVRIAAVNDELDSSNSEEHQILITLLENDSSELVRRAVLLKLNSFSLWLQASRENSNKKVREYAQQQVEAIVLDQHQVKLSLEEKYQFLAEAPKSALLDAWLNTESNIQLALKIFEKIAKPQLLISVFAHRQQLEFQLALLEQVENKELLEKLSKKANLPEVKKTITDKIALITEQEQKPAKITKKAQLALAKLLALKDVSQYSEVIDRKENIINEWQLLANEFDCLEQPQQQDFHDKYHDINQQLDKIFAHKVEAFEQQKIAQQLEQQRAEQGVAIEDKLAACEQTLSNSIFSDNAINETAFNSDINALVQQIETSVLSEQQKADYQAKCQQLQRRVEKLPEIAESVTEATHLISKISQLALPKELSQLNEKETQYLQWLDNFDQIKRKADGTLPESIINAYQEIVTQWQQALKPLHQAQKKHFIQAQKKLADVKRLVNSGKFNAAFGVFKKAETFYLALNDKQQARLARDYQFAQDKINELSDWEHYIATPRKQELLEQIKQLALQPVDNPLEQAALVKKYRQQWNLLGHAEDDKEQALNNDFNQLSEQAFAPCRLYYAEQEKLRTQHLALRQEILEQVKTFNQQLSNQEVDWKELDAKLNQFKQKWRNAGEVERSKYKVLNDEFNTLLKPAKTTLFQHQQDNIARKQALINQAQEHLASEEIENAAKQLKQLQIKWREIGYCGPKQENRLWQEFRAINDQVFERRAILNDSQKQQSAELEQAFVSQLEQIVAQSQTSDSIENLTKALAALSELQQAVKQNSGYFSGLTKKITQQSQVIEQQLAEQRKRAKQQDLITLFECLTQLASGGKDATAGGATLSKPWQKKLNNIPTKDADYQLRHRQTIVLEILAGLDSPDEDQQQRLALQVELMQDQMTSGQNINLEQTFVDWLMLGQLTELDLPLLTRVKPIILANIN